MHVALAVFHQMWATPHGAKGVTNCLETSRTLISAPVPALSKATRCPQSPPPLLHASSRPPDSQAPTYSD
eukprot:2712402-Pyramimonas_sp.AAC.1